MAYREIDLLLGYSAYLPVTFVSYCHSTSIALFAMANQILSRLQFACLNSFTGAIRYWSHLQRETCHEKSNSTPTSYFSCFGVYSDKYGAAQLRPLR